ncbi:MAG: hypothetical protein PHT33_10810 [bacterium]|nr:hypothetical protein [bacterium]
MSCVVQRPAARDGGGKFTGTVVRSSGSCVVTNTSQAPPGQTIISQKQGNR